MGAYHKGEAGAVFGSARTQFKAIECFLKSDEAAAMQHGALEEHLQTQGRELLRQLLQGHLELRALREKRIAVVGSDGCARTHIEASERGLMTIFGPVRVQRLAYRGRGQSALHPLDRELNLPEEKQSHGLRRLAAEDASQLSYDNALSSIRRSTGPGTLAKRQEEGLVQRAARDFDAYYEQAVAREPVSCQDLLVMTSDSKGIVMRPDSLREPTRKAAEQRQHKLPGRLSRGEKRNQKRMATVAAVYEVAPYVRDAEAVLRDLRRLHDARRPRPRARNKRVWASVEKSAETVTRELFDEAERRDPEHLRQWVMLVDGERNQIMRLQAEAKRRGIRVAFVLDLIHVLEYLWSAAWCFFKEGDPEAEAWVTERALRILEGRSSSVAAGIRRSATLHRLRAKDRKNADDCADYLLKKRDLLHYDKYLREGFPIATGVIEGACRHLIKDRLDITGARWSVRGAEAVLKLRAIKSSGDFDAYWTFHLNQEYLRHYESRYAEAA